MQHKLIMYNTLPNNIWMAVIRISSLVEDSTFVCADERSTVLRIRVHSSLSIEKEETLNNVLFILQVSFCFISFFHFPGDDGSPTEHHDESCGLWWRLDLFRQFQWNFLSRNKSVDWSRVDL
jgi:hypothetical protein